jgi:hypothetical protein
MNIPNDTGHPWRLKKFVEYQHEVPSIHYRFIGEYAKKRKLNFSDCIDLFWFCSTCYNEVTAILMFEKSYMKLNPKELKQAWIDNKNMLVFNSSRMYAKSMDWFVPLMYSWHRITKNNSEKWFKGIINKAKSEEDAYTSLYKNLLGVRYVGRFAADVFMECVMYMKDYLDIPIVEPFKLDWKHCSNLTSGLMNIFYEDEAADEFDRTEKILISEDKLYTYLNKIQTAIGHKYPEQDNDIPMFIGKICSFRNLFKSTRYGGYHHDRQLETVKAYEEIYPKFAKRMYELRAEMFPHHLLGELNGWEGIRKERKKLWITKGLTGVEKIAN